MFFRKKIKTISALGFGISLGVLLTLSLGLIDTDEGKQIDRLNLLNFGDLKTKIIDIEERDSSALVLYKNEYPFLMLFKNSSEKIISFGIINGLDHKLAVAPINNEGIETIYFMNSYGLPVLYWDRSPVKNAWQVHYGPSSKINSQSKDFKATGSHYDDFDCDGVFDAKIDYDDNGKIKTGYIWYNEGWLKTPYLSKKELEAYSKQNSKKTYFDFIFEKGWIKRSE